MMANPKTKMFGMLLKAKRLREEQAAEAKQNEKSNDENQDTKNSENSKVVYHPKRQEFCMLYVIYKI